MRYNAERGEYGPGDPDKLTRERVELARKFRRHYLERMRPNGRIIAVHGEPLPGEVSSPSIRMSPSSDETRGS